ncbi:MAG: hypothetical protein M5T52_17680 [Ignavibacteriaceae bacterium]|nr:hypothetical protein [Ignavibacteriaceae bacterium]
MAQGPYSYGPVFEDLFTTQWKIDGQVHGWGWHYVGVNNGPPSVFYRNTNFWEWSNNDIPTDAQLSSVRLRFKAARSGTEHFKFAIHNLNILGKWKFL